MSNKTLQINDQFLFGNDMILCPITNDTNKRTITLIPGDWYLLQLSPSLPFMKNIIGKLVSRRNSSEYSDIEIFAKLYQTPTLFRAGSMLFLRITEKRLLMVIFPGNLITTLYLDQNKPEHFFVTQNSAGELSIRWKQGSYYWDDNEFWYVKVVSSSKQNIWKCSNAINTGTKPFKQLLFKHDIMES